MNSSISINSRSSTMGRLRLLVPLLLPALASAVLPVGEIRFKNAPGYTYCSLAVGVLWIDVESSRADWVGEGGCCHPRSCNGRSRAAADSHDPTIHHTTQTQQAFGPLLPSKSKAPELLLVEPLAGAAAADSIGGKGDGCEPIVSARTKYNSVYTLHTT